MVRVKEEVEEAVEEGGMDIKSELDWGEEEGKNLNQDQGIVKSEHVVIKMEKGQNIKCERMTSSGFPRISEMFTCKMCRVRHVSKASLEQHIQEKHTTKGGWMHCQLCEYKFRKANKLSEHMVACHNQGPGGARNVSVVEEFFCLLCNFSTTTSFNLVTHQSKEHSELPDPDGQYACGSCAFRASTLNAIKSHRYLTHFQRNLADANFDISRLVSCPVCSAQFRDKDSLRNHLLSKHRMDPTIQGTGRLDTARTAPRLFPCAHCTAGFQYITQLESHEKKKHIELPSQVPNFCCSRCNFKPITVYALEVHRKQAHGDETPVTEINPQSPKPEVPLSQMKFSNSLLKFRSTEGMPSGALQPLSTYTGQDANRKKTTQPVEDPSQPDQPPLKKLKAGSVPAPNNLPSKSSPVSFREQTYLPSKPLLGPILVCSLCSFR